MKEYIVKADFITAGNKLVLPDIVSGLIRCKDCRFAHMTTKTSWREPECKYCDIWFPDEACYMDADYYCASAEPKENEE